MPYTRFTVLSSTQRTAARDRGVSVRAPVVFGGLDGQTVGWWSVIARTNTASLSMDHWEVWYVSPFPHGIAANTVPAPFTGMEYSFNASGDVDHSPFIYGPSVQKNGAYSSIAAGGWWRPVGEFGRS